jgi:hypothetical protein
MESRYDDADDADDDADDNTAHGKQADYLHMSTYGCMGACNPATASWVIE